MHLELADVHVPQTSNQNRNDKNVIRTRLSSRLTNEEKAQNEKEAKEEEEVKSEETLREIEIDSSDWISERLYEKSDSSSDENSNNILNSSKD